MLIRHASDLDPSEITPRDVYLNRRSFIAGAAGLGLAAAMPFGAGAAPLAAAKSPFSTDEKLTSREDVTTYNNYYEFGVDKDDPAKNAGTAQDRALDGEGRRPRRQARRVRSSRTSSSPRPSRSASTACAASRAGRWSSPGSASRWPTSSSGSEPQGSAKYVAFETLYRPEEMPGQDSLFPVLDWPYVEGLRIDEAMNPLAILAVGLYGETLPNQNGAPIRLVVPWKYGFKGIKSITRISFVDKEPPTSWNRQASERVRLLRQRQSAGRSPALEPGDRAADRRGRALREAAPDADCSTAMPIRSRASTPAWT